MFSASAPVGSVHVVGVWVGVGQSLGTRRAPLAEPPHWMGGDHLEWILVTLPERKRKCVGIQHSLCFEAITNLNK